MHLAESPDGTNQRDKRRPVYAHMETFQGLKVKN
jgi:hypothetical protein